MAHSVQRILSWTPRMLGCCLAVFLSLFALDAFESGQTLLHNLLAFVMHLAPAATVALIVALAWRWEWVGVVYFSLLGGAYCSRVTAHPDWMLLIGGPLFVMAALFLADALLLHRNLKAEG